MADYFTHFSEVIRQLKPEEEAWLREQLQCIQLLDGHEYPLERVPPHLAGREPDWRGCRFLRDIEDAEDYHDYGPGFDYAFADDEAADGWGRHLWLHDEEGSRLAAVVHFVQKFLRRFRPQDCWSLTCAHVCSHPRVGEFGGGGIVVTAGEDFWLDVHSWAVDQQVLLRRKTEPRPTSALEEFDPGQEAAQDRDDSRRRWALYDFDAEEMLPPTYGSYAKAAEDLDSQRTNVTVVSFEC